jgi:hypothetical protein
VSVEPREPEPVVIEGEIVDLDALLEPKPLQDPPAVVQRPVLCECGKDGTAYSHGAISKRRPFTCAEVLEIRARVEASDRRSWWRRILGGAR